MFDLPVGTKKERKAASVFRKNLLKDGFDMSQFSVYTKYCSSLEKSESICNHVATYLPAGGKVDILTITDRQFSNMKRFYAKKQLENERHPRQLHLF